MKRSDWLLFSVVALASSLWCLSASRHLGATFDEPPHLAGGLEYWHTGRFTQLLLDGAMPLAQHLQTLPVFISEQTSGRRLTVENDLGEILRLARPVTLFFWLLLLVSVMQLARLLGGSWAGRLALLLVAADPNFLAHASLATTDLAVTACFTLFVWQFLASRHERSTRRVLVPAIAFGLALTAKVSALALFPFALAASWLRQPHDRAAVRRLLIDAVLILVIGLLFNVLYCGTGGRTWLDNTLSTMSADHWLRPVVVWLGSLPIFPNAFYAIWYQLGHNTTGQAVYVAGQVSTHALWYYVPLVLTIKLTVPQLAAAAFGLVVAQRRSLLAAVGFLIAAMVIVRVQTGVRLLLPLLAPALAWIAAQAIHAIPERRRVLAFAVPGVMAIESLVVWPDALRYVNPLWSGTENGYRVVSDSNYDWGQGLPELSAWQRADGRPMAVWYFGTDTRFPELVRFNPREPGGDRRALDGRLLAVSASFLYGGYLETAGPANDLIRRLRAETPLASTSTFFIFDSGY